MQVILKGGGVEGEEGGCTTRHGGAGGPALLALFRRLDLETNLVRSLAPSLRPLPATASTLPRRIPVASFGFAGGQCYTLPF